MRWEYNPEFRQLFSRDGGVHCDILIVPHATNVTPVEGGPPEVTSKVPKFDNRGRRIQNEYEDVAFTITNEDIIKEKFEYTNAINSSDNLTFRSCESAMVKFSIRNLKNFVIDGTDDQGNEKGHYELVIPNLAKYEIVDPNDPNKFLVGEVQAQSVIKLYMYYNGDSSTLIYMGMFVVEDDKVTEDGHEREIIAYDFLATLRDMDIFEWYKRLFKGVHKQDKKGNDIEDQYWPGLKGKSKWTIKEALNDLFTNLATFDPCVKTVTNPSEYLRDYESDEYCGYGMPIMLDPDLFDPTKTYSIPKESDEDAYECYGYMEVLNLPFLEDEKILRSGSLSLGKFLEDIGVLAGRYPSIRIDKIVDGDYVDPDYIDPGPPDPGPNPPSENENQNGGEIPSAPQPSDVEANDDPPEPPETDDKAPESKYNLYERCILTFKPLSRDDIYPDENKIPEEVVFDPQEIAKGIKYDTYIVQSIMFLELYNYSDEKPLIKYGNLTKEQKQRIKNGETLPSLIITDNVFTSYLTPNKENLDKDIKEQYEEIIKLLAADGEQYVTWDDDKDPETPKKKEKWKSGDGYLHTAYKNIKYRTYVPYELSTTADPCRDVGDRILVNTIDKVTGERAKFQTYILERKLSGIQAMMDTYTAKGDLINSNFADYKSGTKSSSSGYALQTFGFNGSGTGNTTTGDGGSKETGTGKTTIVKNINGLTNDQFVEIIRNIGLRLLDEPTKVSVDYGISSINPTKIPLMSQPPYVEDEWYFQECLTELTDGCDTNPITILVNDFYGEEYWEIEYTAKPYDTLPYGTDPDDYLYVFGEDEKWHAMRSQPYYVDEEHEIQLEEMSQYPDGDVVFNTVQMGDRDTVIRYYYLDENNKMVTGTCDVNLGTSIYMEECGVGSGSYSYIYPGVWWNTGEYPYGGENFSGDLPDLTYYYNYYGNLSGENGYTNPPGLNEYNRRTVPGESGNRLVTGLKDGSTQNPLVYISSTGDIYSYVRSYCMVPYSTDTSVSEYDKYYIYGTDNKWHAHVINCIGDSGQGDTVPTDINTGDTNNPITINGESVEVKYGDYFVYNNYSYSYNYPGVWWRVNSSDHTYPWETIITSPTYQSKPAVFLKWTDPKDIITEEPERCIWEGTVVVRKEGSAPLNPWDGTVLIEDSKVRNQYKKSPLIDDTVEINKKYYYGIFPYHFSENDNKYHYRYTKVVSVNTEKITDAPEITSLQTSGKAIKVDVSVPAGLKNAKIVYKESGIPDNVSDGIAIDIGNATSLLLKGFSANITYFFAIFAQDEDDDSNINSDAKSLYVTEDMPNDVAFIEHIEVSQIVE